MKTEVEHLNTFWESASLDSLGSKGEIAYPMLNWQLVLSACGRSSKKKTIREAKHFKMTSKDTTV